MPLTRNRQNRVPPPICRSKGGPNPPPPFAYVNCDEHFLGAPLNIWEFSATVVPNLQGIPFGASLLGIPEANCSITSQALTQGMPSSIGGRTHTSSAACSVAIQYQGNTVAYLTWPCP